MSNDIKRGFFEDDKGNNSSMRIISLITVCAASLPLIGIAVQMVTCSSVSVEVLGPLAFIFTAALGSKVGQKFAK